MCAAKWRPYDAGRYVCVVLWYVTLCCYVRCRSVLLCSVPFCSVMFCAVLFCYVLLCSVMFCAVLLCLVLLCSVILFSVLFCYVLLIRFLCCSVMFCYILFCCVFFSAMSSVHFRSIFALTCSLYFPPFTLSVHITATNVPTRILHNPPPPPSFISFPFLSFFLSMRVAMCSVRPIHYFLRVFVVRFSFEVVPITQYRHLRNIAVNILIQTSQLHTSNSNQLQ
jgi:hypothetical protein